MEGVATENLLMGLLGWLRGGSGKGRYSRSGEITPQVRRHLLEAQRELRRRGVNYRDHLR